MTKRQKELLDFIRKYVKKNEMSPTYREMSNSLKNKSFELKFECVTQRNREVEGLKSMGSSNEDSSEPQPTTTPRQKTIGSFQ